jgi:VanZ family protein
MARSRIASLWLPVLMWAGVIFALSAIPSLSSGLGTWDLVLRKAAHVTEYAVLGGLLLRAVRRAPFALALGLLNALTDELHQSFVPGRAGRPADVAIDAAGLLCGIVLYEWARDRVRTRLAR